MKLILIYNPIWSILTPVYMVGYDNTILSLFINSTFTTIFVHWFPNSFYFFHSFFVFVFVFLQLRLFNAIYILSLVSIRSCLSFIDLMMSFVHLSSIQTSPFHCTSIHPGSTEIISSTLCSSYPPAPLLLRMLTDSLFSRL